jgi:hypothetical protein
MDSERVRPALAPTGDPRVDEAVARLASLDDLDLAERPAVLADVHDRLREILGELGEDRQGAAAPARPAEQSRPGEGRPGEGRPGEHGRPGDQGRPGEHVRPGEPGRRGQQGELGGGSSPRPGPPAPGSWPRPGSWPAKPNA